MQTEIIVFVFVFIILMAKMENKREWLYNIKHNKLINWRKKWHSIPTTKLVFVLFILLLFTAVVSSFFPIELNYLAWDLFFIAHFSLYLLAGVSLYLFVWCLGGRAMRSGSEVGSLSKVEGTEPSGKKKAKKPSFVDGMFKSTFNAILGDGEKNKKEED